MPKRPAKQSQDQKLQAKIEELTADLQRVHADFVNYRRRSQSEQAQIMEVAKQAVLAKLLPVFDNLERSLRHIPKDLENTPWAQGVIQTAKQVEATLKKLGVEKIPAKGQKFDPRLHEALQFEGGVGEHEVISEELQPGYKMGDQVLRPSLVKVKKQPGGGNG